MKQELELDVDGQGATPDGTTELALLRMRLKEALRKFYEAGHRVDGLRIDVKGQGAKSRDSVNRRGGNDDVSVEERAGRYNPAEPKYKFEQLIVPESVQRELEVALELIVHETKVFDDWGLREVEPSPKSALNFHGPPGTGKTLAAHAIAQRLNRKILVSNYADIESKFHGDGPKNVQAIFYAAERQKAVLFIDEADSLLSKRIAGASNGSEQAINSMRSQLLICLEEFSGTVVFATNFVENYDRAFETRVRNIHFSLPDEPARQKIWLAHFVPRLPVSEREATAARLAKEVDDVCGREIRNAVVQAAIKVVARGDAVVGFDDLVAAIQSIKSSRVTKNELSVSSAEKVELEKRIKDHLKKRGLKKRGRG